MSKGREELFDSLPYDKTLLLKHSDMGLEWAARFFYHNWKTEWRFSRETAPIIREKTEEKERDEDESTFNCVASQAQFLQCFPTCAYLVLPAGLFTLLTLQCVIANRIVWVCKCTFS